MDVSSEMGGALLKPLSDHRNTNAGLDLQSSLPVHPLCETKTNLDLLARVLVDQLSKEKLQPVLDIG